MKLFIAAIVKNELDALLEWIAYHRVLGVSGFIIADNGSNDGTRELLGGLAKLGVVTVLDFPTVGTQKPQLPAYEKYYVFAHGMSNYWHLSMPTSFCCLWNRNSYQSHWHASFQMTVSVPLP
ncbi:glycosyltransferase family 2 protein [Aeromonas hydrophila]